MLMPLLRKASLLEERNKILQEVSQAHPARFEEAAELPCLQRSLLRFEGRLETGVAEFCTLSCNGDSVCTVYKKT